MVPQRQEPIVPLMLGTPPASRAGSWLMTSVLGDGSFGVPRFRGTRVWSVRGPPIGRPLTHCQGSGGQVRAPCPLAVVGIDDKLRGQAGACFYSLHDGASINIRELKKFLQANLALYKIPREFHELSALPRTSTGKIAKRQILKDFLAKKNAK